MLVHSTLVAILVISAVVVLCVGVFTSLISLLAKQDRLQPPVTMNTEPIYWSFAQITVLLGIVFLLAPQSWFGPSWSYFSFILPHNGFGIGSCCVGLGGLLMVALWRRGGARILWILLFLNGFVYWTSGIILGAEGLLGHQGLMEAPLFMAIGAHAYAHSVRLRMYSRQEKTR